MIGTIHGLRDAAVLGSVLGGCIAIAGCSGWSAHPPVPGNPVTAPMNVGAVQSTSPKGGTGFTPALSREYAAMSGDYQQHANYAAADYFGRKGLSSASGTVVPPEYDEAWLVPMEVPMRTRDTLKEQRQRLVGDLDQGGRERYPALSARAQSRYDCWVEESEKDWHAVENGRCRAEMMAALDELERNLHPAVGQSMPNEIRVYFAFDRADLDPEAKAIIDHVAAAARGGTPARVSLIGRADRVGSDAYNQTLSTRRAEAVRNALVSDGVPANEITVRGEGERNLPVPTAEEVPEPRNRVVDIGMP